MKLQAALSLVLALSFTAIPTASHAALTPTVSPIAPVARNGKSEARRQEASAKNIAAHVTRAAICTEDISQIKFSEYYVDWSLWMNEVADRWSNVFNAGYNNGKFHTDGPAFVEFTVKRDGSISEISLHKSSGDLLCDRGQIEALVNCMPLPAFPVGSRKKSVTLLYVWEYSGHPARVSKPIAKATRKQQPDGPTRITISGKLM